jgi:hypothetical protein
MGRDGSEGAARTEVERGGILGDHAAWRFMTRSRDCRGSSSSVGTVESTPAPVRRAAGAIPQAPAPEQGGQKLKHSPAFAGNLLRGPGRRRPRRTMYLTLRGDRARRLSSESHWHRDCHGPGSSLPVPELPEPVPELLRLVGFRVMPGRVTVTGPTVSASLPRLRVAREPWPLTGIDSRPPDVWASLAATSKSDSET